jgi:hypothetical protein
MQKHWNNGKETLEAHQATMSTYLKSLGSFNYENELCHIIKRYKSHEWHHCHIENHPIKEVFLVQSFKTGKIYEIGNHCIDKLGNAKITEWFRRYQAIEDYLAESKTQNMLDIYAGFLNAIENNTLPFKAYLHQIDMLRDGYDRVISHKKLLKHHITTIKDLTYIIEQAFPNWKPSGNN